MNMVNATAYPHIIKEDGKPARLESHPRVRVAQIVMDYLAYGWSADEIHRQHPHLALAEVHAAMGYYYDTKRRSTPRSRRSSKKWIGRSTPRHVRRCG